MSKINSNSSGFNEAVTSTCRFSIKNEGTTAQYYWVNTTAHSTLSGGGSQTNATLRSGSSTPGTSSSPQTLAVGSTASFVYEYSVFPAGSSGSGKTQTLVCAANVNVQDTTSNPGKVGISGTITFFTETTQKHFDGSTTTNYLGSASTNVEAIEFSSKVF